MRVPPWVRPVDDAGVGMWAVDPHERLGAAVGEGFEIVGLIGDEANVLSLQIDRPGIDIGGAIFDRELRRVIDSRVVPDFDAGVVPPEEMVAGVTVIGQSDVLFEERAPGMQNDLHRPIHPVYAVAISYRHRGAAIGRTAE